MENIRIVVSFIAGFIFVFEWYILMGKKNTKFTFSNYRKIWSLSIVVSLVLSSIGAILSYLIYNEVDILMLAVLIVNAIMTLLLLVLKRNKNNEIIEVKAGTYSISSELTLFKYNVENAESYMKVDKGEDEIYIVFHTVPPELDKNIILDCTKIDEGLYRCNTYIYDEKIKFVNILKIMLDYYVMLLFTYGCSIAVTDYLNYSIASDTEILGLTFGYIIFNFAYNKTKYGKNGFTKFMHFVFGVFYVITLIEIISIAII